MQSIEGLEGISATVIADSISPEGIRLTTFEITYPRIVLAELNTHKMLSKASASSRAIPFEKMKDNLTGRPVRFGAANPGMQDTGKEHDRYVGAGISPRAWWDMAKASALVFAEHLFKAGFHKQVYNRLTEPFQMMKTVITATEWNNFFWLRDDGAADPSLAELARCMREARNASAPLALQPGEWHLPYVLTFRHTDDNGQIGYAIHDDSDQGAQYLSLEEALIVSTARCAAVSFRNVDYDVPKSRAVYERLIGDDRKHASAFEHQGTPMFDGAIGRVPDGQLADPATWEAGTSHMTRDCQLWSGNLRGWVQHRKLIVGENKEG